MARQHQPRKYGARRRSIHHAPALFKHDRRQSVLPHGSLKSAFAKQRYFRWLSQLESGYEALAAPQSQALCGAIKQIREVMGRNWSILILRCRYQNSTEEHWMIFTQLDVIESLLRLLRAHISVVRWCVRRHDNVDTKDFDERLLRLITPLHDRTKSHIRYKACPEPESWTSKEAEQWERYEDILRSRRLGKVVLKEWLCEGSKDMLDPARIVIEDNEGDDLDLDDLDSLEAVVERTADSESGQSSTDLDLE